MAAANGFVVKDSGERQQFASGMQRDTETGKINYLPLLRSPVLDTLARLMERRPDIDWTLVFDGPLFEEWAQHLTDGARKYQARNWMKAAGTEELERFERSSARHYVQWVRGERDERHHAGVVFNLNGAEYVRGHLGAIEALAQAEHDRVMAEDRRLTEGAVRNPDGSVTVGHPEVDHERAAHWRAAGADVYVRTDAYNAIRAMVERNARADAAPIEEVVAAHGPAADEQRERHRREVAAAMERTAEAERTGRAVYRPEGK